MRSLIQSHLDLDLEVHLHLQQAPYALCPVPCAVCRPPWQAPGPWSAPLPPPPPTAPPTLQACSLCSAAQAVAVAVVVAVAVAVAGTRAPRCCESPASGALWIPMAAGGVRPEPRVECVEWGKGVPSRKAPQALTPTSTHPMHPDNLWSARAPRAGVPTRMAKYTFWIPGSV